ncbi:hypothetical protein Verru16b_00742 [Lacunisphaera limnophila]|uniref:Tetratricopeptide repeat protein n=2 Tax=Lacunisphaera limnophila TaxID=1838286 RepID=A0A1D8AS47_9BACT|nr:hypothetical protein Verru16b_00742 [Lacunisphaera limnophila]
MRATLTRWLERPGLLPAVCALGPLLLFTPVLGGGFLIWDDNVNLLHNPALWQPEGAWRWMFTDLESVQRYKPLNWLLWRLLGDGFGLNPVAFHGVNLLLHAGNSVLLFFVTIAFLDDRAATAPSWTRRVAALIGTLGWALHPLRVEPVAWISGAGYPLATCFGLLAVLAFQRHLRDERAGWHWTAVGCFLISLLSYPATASLPALLLVLYLLSRRRASLPRGMQLREAARRLAPYALAAFLLLGLTLTTRLTTSGEVWNRPADLAEAGLPVRLSQAFSVWVWYAEKTVLPLHLAPVYVDFREFSAGGFRGLASPVILGLIGYLAWRLRRRWPEAGPLWVAYLALAVLVLGVTDLPFTPSDRYTYVPALALALLCASGVQRALQASLRTTGVAALLLLTGLTLASHRQLAHWATPRAFFTHALARVGNHPAGVDLHWRLGLHHLMADDPMAARAEFEEVLRLNPRHEDAARYLRVLSARAKPSP